MKKTTLTVSVIMIVLIVGLVGVYAYMSGRARTDELDSIPTEVQKILNMDLTRSYPGTVRGVVREYSQIVRYFYAESTTDEELEALGLKAREYFDEELLANNELEAYLRNLKEDVRAYKDKKRTITNVVVADSVNVDYFEEDGYEFARLLCGYNVTEGRTTTQVPIIYLLRKDESGRWKIYGWDNAENVHVQ